MDARAGTELRKLNDLEVMFWRPVIEGIGRRIRAISDKSPDGASLYALTLNGTLHAWEHEGVLALAQVHVTEGRSVACVAYAAGTLAQLLKWYAAWEAECRRYGISEMRVGGRKGWLRISQKLNLGFVAGSNNDIVKRLD